MVQEASSADGASLGAISIEADGASPRPGDDAKGMFQDWVICCNGISAPRSATLGVASPAPGSSGAAGAGVSGLLLPDSLGFSPSPIYRR
jgi:hypothetical protein